MSISLQQARALLPPEDRNMSDAELAGLMASLYAFADLCIDQVLERRKVVVRQ